MDDGSNFAVLPQKGVGHWLRDRRRPDSNAPLIRYLNRGSRRELRLHKNYRRKLAALGHEVTVVPRIGYREGADGRHDLILNEAQTIEEHSRITLIHADPLLLEADLPLKNFLENATKFDAVTVWLIGTYNVRKSCRTLDALPINDAKDYRLILQNRIYELADLVLNPGGVLHVVDRGLTPDTEHLREMAFRLHREQASVTSLQVSDFAFRAYKEPEVRGVGMTGLVTENPTIVDDGRRAMQSMVSVKPRK